MNTVETNERKFATRPTTTTTLMQSFEGDIADNPFQMFTRYPQCDVRARCMEKILATDPVNAPKGWVQDTILSLREGYVNDTSWRRLLEWYVLKSGINGRNDDLILEALTFAAGFLDDRTYFEDMSFVMTQIAKKLDIERAQEFPQREYYWHIDLSGRFKKVLERFRESFKKCGYETAAWSLVDKAFKQVVEVGDTSLLEILKEIAAAYVSSEVKPCIISGSRSSGEYAFPRVALIDHPAIWKARIAHLEEEERLHRWNPGFLEERIRILNLADWEINLWQHPGVDGTVTVGVGVSTKSESDAALIRSMLKNVCICVKPEGFLGENAWGMDGQFGDDNTWRHTFMSVGSVGRLWISFCNDNSPRLTFRENKEGWSAVYVCKPEPE